MQLRLNIFFILINVFCVDTIFAQSKKDMGDSSPIVESSTKKTSVSLAPYYFRFDLAGLKFSGVGLAVAAKYARFKQLGFKIELHNSVLTEDDFSNLFTAIKYGLYYSPFRRINIEERSLRFLEKEVVKPSVYVPSGIRLNLHISQYFINARKSILSYTGIGAGLGYVYGLNNSIGIKPEIQFDLLRNGGNVAISSQYMLGFSYWF